MKRKRKRRGDRKIFYFILYKRTFVLYNDTEQTFCFRDNRFAGKACNLLFGREG